MAVRVIKVSEKFFWRNPETKVPCEKCKEPITFVVSISTTVKCPYCGTSNTVEFEITS